jgi:hypothetical protein
MNAVVPILSLQPPALGRRLTAAVTLLLLFLAGPVHVWHHTVGAVEHIRVGDDGGQCVPCAAFQKNSLAPAAAAPVAWTSVCLGVVRLADSPTPIEVQPLSGCSRAPPCPQA